MKLNPNLFHVESTHLQPMKTNCSQNQASVSISTMTGKANANQDAKLITSPFWGKSLQEREEEIRP